ncbi:hypothetical protein OIE13_26935 [Streptosporangium sp. NBC_01810]|uniref:hypothetical protein n=1 Tax=Streptosporangium sp. NBC_01810 TaxID=2975951 RepID=UPI002DD7FC5F|nr:hypothetical protein [Streptosporangium sp. NBC_01810]WSA24555.1 hypothetical protein OIE13_26935 [Streptosporangium sp. NBC_01810]
MTVRERLPVDGGRAAPPDWLIRPLGTNYRWATNKHPAPTIGKKILDDPAEAAKKVTP